MKQWGLLLKNILTGKVSLKAADKDRDDLLIGITDFIQNTQIWEI